MYLVRIPKVITGLFPEYRWEVQPHQVALTFDDGPYPESTPELLKILSEANCPSTHFLLGKQVVENPGLVSEIIEKGHAVGHHSFSHPNGWNVSLETYVKDVEAGYGQVQTLLFRPPYGKITPRQWKAIHEKYPGMQCCQFNFMPGDFDEKVDEVLLRNRMYQVKGGEMIVLHDRPDCFGKYASFLKTWITDIRAQGLEFVILF